MESTSSPSILVVDDEVDACRNLADIFEDFGFQVDTAHNGRSAMELVRKRRYDVAVLDLMMPGMDGAELFHEIRKERSGIVGLLVTAYPTHPRAEAAMQTGVWRLLPKPLDFRQLMTTIEEAVGQPLVLVVDDDTDLCANLWDLLREQGYRVCMAHDVDKAIELVGGDEFRVVLLDMNLPGGDGSQVFQRARDRDPNMPVIVITGCDIQMQSKIEHLFSEGASVLHKPLDVGALMDQLRKMAPTEAHR